jgi:pimeloyl-ACP methyl ester carboxylesterase
VIRRAAAAGVAGVASVASLVALRTVARRGGERLMAAPRTGPDEVDTAPALDAMGGEVVRLRSRDGVRLAGRWLPAETTAEAAAETLPEARFRPDPHAAILLLHGYSGSVAPDLLEYGPFLRTTAGVLGLDFRGHGESDDGPTTFGLLEVEDVAGALAWLGERGITRVSLVGTSMGGIVAIASVALLGDGSLPAADVEPDLPRDVVAAPRPRIVAVVAESVPPELVVPIASRLRGPARRFVAGRLFDAIARRLGGDPRETEPGRVIGLVEPVPLLLIHGTADTTVPLADGYRLAALAGPSAQHWVVPDADHSGAHRADPEAYERRVTAFLRQVAADVQDGQPILPAPASGARPSTQATLVED